MEFVYNDDRFLGNSLDTTVYQKGGKTMKKFFTLILCALMLLPLCVVSHAAYNGTCGESAAWKISGDTLIIYGTGTVTVTEAKEWKDLAGKIKSLNVEEGITGIGNEVFMNFTSVTAITLPESLKTIGDRAFMNTRMTTLNIPDGVTDIGTNAFKHCIYLDTVNIGKGVTEVGGCFTECTGLRHINFGENVKKIGAFSGCTLLGEVNIPASVTNIYPQGFDGCSSFTDINVDAGNTVYSSIDGVLFDKDAKTLIMCPYARGGDYVIPDSVETVGFGAFRSRRDIKSVIFGKNVKTIEKDAFYNCKIEAAVMPEGLCEIGNYAFEYCNDLRIVYLSNTLERIGKYAFSSCTALENVDLPDSLTEIGDSAFEKCTVLYSVNGGKGLKIIGNMAFGQCPALTQFTLYNGLETIGDYAFYEDKALQNVSLPVSLVSIGRGAFANCTGITSVAIPKSTEYVGASAFAGTSLSDLNFASVKADVCSNAFSNTPWYASQADGFIYLGTSLYALKGHMVPGTEVKVKDGTKRICAGAFSGCGGLYSIELPSSLEIIENYAFNGCTGLKNTVIPKNVKYIGSGAFYGCTSLTEFTFPAGIKELDWYTFRGCSSLAKVTIPETLHGISYYAFDGSAVKDIYFYGSRARFDNMAKAEEQGSFSFGAVNVHCDAYPHSTALSDLPNGSWYTEPALWCVANGYISGTSASAFSPSGTLTRAQFVQILAKLDVCDLSQYGKKQIFGDVPCGKWYSAAVEWASEFGVTGGTGGGNFSPDAPVTRQQLAVFLYTYASKRGADMTPCADIGKYTDAASVSTWAQTAIKWAVARGVISGTDAKTLSPAKTTTRAEAAAMLRSFADKVLTDPMVKYGLYYPPLENPNPTS